MIMLRFLYYFVVLILKIVVSVFIIYTVIDATKRFPSLPSGLAGGIVPIALKWITDDNEPIRKR